MRARDDMQDSRTSDVSDDETIDEIRSQYRGEWIIVRVTQPNDKGEPVRGYVLDHGRYRRNIQKTVMLEIERSKRAQDQFYVFFGHETLAPGTDWKWAQEDIIERSIRLGRGRR